jgi:hypothetical protein
VSWRPVSGTGAPACGRLVVGQAREHQLRDGRRRAFQPLEGAGEVPLEGRAYVATVLVQLGVERRRVARAREP